MIAAGLHGIDNELPLEPAFAGNAYADDSVARAAYPARRPGAVGGQRARREAFGDEVVAHYANYARVELAAFDAAVTDWELLRGFERL